MLLSCYMFYFGKSVLKTTNSDSSSRLLYVFAEWICDAMKGKKYKYIVGSICVCLAFLCCFFPIFLSALHFFLLSIPPLYLSSFFNFSFPSVFSRRTFNFGILFGALWTGNVFYVDFHASSLPAFRKIYQWSIFTFHVILWRSYGVPSQRGRMSANYWYCRLCFL